MTEKVSHAEKVSQLRIQFQSLLRLGVVGPDADITQAMCIGVLNEAEKARRAELDAAINLEKRAAASRAKAEGFSMISSMVQNVIRGYARAAERQAEEEARVAAEAKELAATSKKKKGRAKKKKE